MATGPPQRYFQVVVNVEGQYGIWPLYDAVPGGWSPIGFVSTYEECLTQVAELWHDMRPLAGRGTGGDAPVTVVDRIRRIAERQPGAAAVTEIGVRRRRITYGELISSAERLARRLTALGVGPEDRVALCFPVGADALTALLGVALSGAAWLPVDVDDVGTWRDLVIADSGARLVVTPSARWLKHLDLHILSWPDDVADGHGTLPGIRPAGAACVLYRPEEPESRGVILEHRQLGALIDGALLPPVRSGDRVTPSGRFSSGLIVLEILHALASGAELVVGEPRGERGERRPVRPGADPSGVALADRAVSGSAAPAAVEPQLYGFPETAIACARRVVEENGREGPRVLIGPPRRGCRLHALDADFEPVAVGAVGLLYVGGVALARGYLDDPAATVTRFLPDPFAADGSRMFATGHRVRLLSGGRLEFLGADRPIRVWRG
ncbi:AMP-binding protein [Rhizohabitans arisaemae]|uniref:AMP-binding protein n=1 Tax=Rhizohabitans arisaemae TaxID=2720610 RepID=UPI0024B0F6D8|nr:AMP-binding protein [Rhizohabitans arisaemae]